MVPTTRDEWWTLLNANWLELQNILYRFCPMSEQVDCYNNPISATMEQTVQRLKDVRDPDIARYLNLAWGLAPDDISIHSIPSWHTLCNLCSEEYVLYDEADSI